MTVNSLQNILNILKPLEKLDLNEINRKIKEYKFDETLLIYIEKFINNIKCIEKKEFQEIIWKYIPVKEQTAYHKYIEDILNSISNISTISVDDDDFKNKKKRIENILIDSYGYLYNFLEICRNFKNTKLINDTELFIDEMKNKAIEAEKELEKIKSITASVQEELSKTEVSKSAIIFKKQVLNNWWAVILWGIASIALTIFVMIKLNDIFDTKTLNNLLNQGWHIQALYLLMRFFIVSIYVGILYILFKNVNANLHLVTLNKHRANCMDSFEKFLQSTDNKDIKDVILTQATDAIFKTGDTGFLKGSSHDNPMSIGAIKVIEQLNGKGQ